MANQSYERQPLGLKSASVAAYAISGRPTRPEESSLGERSASATRVLPRTKPRPPEMPEHVADMIVDYIVQNAGNVTDLFFSWDKNNDGLIDKREFRHFLNAVGFPVPRECSDAFYDSFDEDGSGFLDYCELVRKTRKLAFERGKNPKPKPKPGNRSVTRFNEKWAEKNIEHTKAFRRSVAEGERKATAKMETEVAVRRTAQLQHRRERRDQARTLGAELLEPYRLRQQQEERRATPASLRPASSSTLRICWRTHFSRSLQMGSEHGPIVGGCVGATGHLPTAAPHCARDRVRVCLGGALA